MGLNLRFTFSLGQIRALAVTPSQAKEMDFADVTTICSDYTINGLVNMAALANKPFRFIYTSGVMIERDQEKSLPFLSDYRLMRVCNFLRSCHSPVASSTLQPCVGRSSLPNSTPWVD